MNIFCRKYEKLEYESKISGQRQEGGKEFKDLKLEKRDIIALIVAAFQIILPFAIGIVAIYFLIILFLTKVWM